MDENNINEHLPVDTSFEFKPQNPFTMDIPSQKSNQEVAYPGFTEDTKAGVFETAEEEFKNTASSYNILHAANAPLTEHASMQARMLYPDADKFYKPAPPGWSPKVEIEKQTNLDSKFIPKLLSAKTPADFQYRLEDLQAQQHQDQVLENGSTLGKILGGALGYTLGSVENFIPLAALASKAKVGSGFISAALRTAPGVTVASAVREGAKQMDSLNPNLSEFLKDTFIDTAFGITFFGGLGAAKTLMNISTLNKLKGFARSSLDGIGYDFVVNKKGNVTGFKAISTTPGEALSAAKVTKAQEMADAAFHQGGLFKIPYVGKAAAHVLSGNIPGFEYVFGSPLMQMKLSKYKSANAFADAAFDHFITTEGEMKGQVRPPSFELKMKKTRAMLTALKAETMALHAERNGYKTESRPLIGLANAWSSVKQKTIETLSRDTQSTPHVIEEDFMDEVQRVMISGTSSEHAAVNELASKYRDVHDTAIKGYLKAYNLPEDYFRNMETYLSRVYNTPYMTENEQGESGWVPIISNYFKEADELITERMQPINDLQKQIKDFETAHTEAVEELGRREAELNPGTEIVPVITTLAKPIKIYKVEGKKRLTSGVKEIPGKQQKGIDNEHVMTLARMRQQLTSMKEKLQNELRDNPEYDYHVEDRLALSANEAKELKGLLQPLNNLQKQIDAQQELVSKLKAQKSRKLSYTKKQETVEKAKPHAQEYVAQKENIEKEEEKLHDLKLAHSDEEYDLYHRARTGQINARLYNPVNFKLKDPNDRLRFRDVFNSHEEREVQAKASYDSILQMNPEDVISDIFGKVMGISDANPLKKRTLLVPDKLLYDNNFMTKDLYSKTANYVNFLARRTHLKTSFANVTVNGGFEELAESLLNEHNANRDAIHQKLEKLTDEKEIKKEKKNLSKESKDFGKIKKSMKQLYENRMMGINKRNDFDNMARRVWMSLASMVNLHNLPATQITDLAFGGFQHGIWPHVRDGIYPLVTSMGNMLKTKDAEALREMAPHIHLGYQDMLNNYADRNFNSELQPYLNMGKIVSGTEKLAHFSSLTDLAPYIDNGVQRANASTIQGRFMELLHKQLEGTLSKNETLYLVKYGINPKKWTERMVNAYKESGGFKTKLGGYISKAWQWQDLEAANLFNDAVFRGVQNTLVFKGMADSPFFADNILGMFFHTFTGWGYAATNRYLIPSLQNPEGALLLKMMWMMSAGALVSPMRRISRGEQPWPDDMNDSQIAYEAWNDSGVFSSIGNVLNIANMMTDNKLLGDLKNDKFKNRMKTGIFGFSDVISSTASRISNVIDQIPTGWNEKDMKTAAHMLPIAGAMYGHYFSDKLIESWNLPQNKRAAENQ